MQSSPVCGVQESDAPEQLMAAFGTAAALIQQSQFAHCRCRHASLDTTSQDSASSLGEVDEESLAAAKQVQKELQKAMHAALSANNGILIIPTLPGPPIQRRYAPCNGPPCWCCCDAVMMCMLPSLPTASVGHSCPAWVLVASLVVPPLPPPHSVRVGTWLQVPARSGHDCNITLQI